MFVCSIVPHSTLKEVLEEYSNVTSHRICTKKKIYRPEAWRGQFGDSESRTVANLRKEFFRTRGFDLDREVGDVRYLADAYNTKNLEVFSFTVVASYADQRRISVTV